MNHVLVAAIVFAVLAMAALVSMAVFPRRQETQVTRDTEVVVRLVAGLFTLMTSLVFGLMINSAKNTYETIDRNVHDFATHLIIFDRTLRHYGYAGNDARSQLSSYVDLAIASPTRAADLAAGAPDASGLALDRVGDALAIIVPASSYHEATLLDARQQYHRLVEERWALVEESEGTLPAPVILLLVAWLCAIFAAYGYRAPRNRVVVATFLGSALLLAVSFYLVLDMNVPFRGPVSISDEPLRRAQLEIAGAPPIRPEQH